MAEFELASQGKWRENCVVMAIIEVTDVHLPQCECQGCGSTDHQASGRCHSKAAGLGTVFCVPCETALTPKQKM